MSNDDSPPEDFASSQESRGMYANVVQLIETAKELVSDVRDLMFSNAEELRSMAPGSTVVTQTEHRGEEQLDQPRSQSGAVTSAELLRQVHQTYKDAEGLMDHTRQVEQNMGEQPASIQYGEDFVAQQRKKISDKKREKATSEVGLTSLPPVAPTLSSDPTTIKEKKLWKGEDSKSFGIQSSKSTHIENVYELPDYMKE